MKNFWVVFCVSVCCNLAAHAVLVSGYAYLSGQSDHGNIRVIFEEVSPSAETDTTYTNDNGYFAHVIQPGVYNVIYSHDQFATYRLPNQVLLWDTTLDPVTLMTPLSGHLSGTLDPADYQVVDSIVVDSGASLTILPGTRLFFEYRKRFLVYGLLTAVGTETDSILFTRRTPSADSLWGGIRFIYADSLSRLEYCVVEYSSGSAGVTFEYSNGTLLQCTFRKNQSSSCIFCYYASPHVEGCSIVGNRATGIYCYGGAPLFENCFISLDTTYESGAVSIYGGSPSFTECQIVHNTSYNSSTVTAGSPAHFERCLISNNWSTEAGGVSAWGASEFVDCIIAGNRGQRAGGINCYTGTFTRCTIANNIGTLFYSTADAVRFENATASFTSCILAGRGENHALYFYNSPNADIRYCDIFAGDSAAIDYYEDDPSNAPLIFGLNIVTNANGDSCDTYYNIFLDPQFADTANGDYHLTATSPCIDAGDPELQPDPDGTVADMGAFYFNQLDADDSFILPPSSFILSAYPNPFNSATRIEFDLPHAGHTELTIYDVTGREIRTLATGPLAAGRHEVLFDAAELPSGIYFYRLNAGAIEQTRKMVLIR